jgi:hypothetical protein
MNKPGITETSILGLLFGSGISAYLTYVIGSEGPLGKILELISLRPILEQILNASEPNISNTVALIITFVFFLIVFTAYGALIGLILKFSNRTKYIVIGLIVITAIVAGEHIFHIKRFVPVIESQNLPALASKSFERKPEKYFGMEAYGDLSGDEKEDVAFIINRKDPERGMLYYLTTAISTTEGREGTNLIFLGDKVVPVKIEIKEGKVVISYIEGSEETPGELSAHIENGELIRITEVQPSI